MDNRKKAEEMAREIRRLEREYGFKIVADLNFDLVLQNSEDEFSMSRLEGGY